MVTCQPRNHIARDPSGYQETVLTVLMDNCCLLTADEIADKAGLKISSVVSAITNLSTDYPIYEETGEYKNKTRVRFGILNRNQL